MSEKVSNEGSESENTFEINIKTLETQVHKVRVTANMLVSELKEKIVDLTEVPVEQQRLIFRGRVLKDNDPLSEYHVEDGHTLHLVARRPNTGTSSTDANPNTGNESNANEQPNNNRQGQFLRNILLGSVNIAEGGEDISNEIIRGVGELLRSIGAGIPAPGVGPTNTTSNGQNGANNGNNRGPSVNQVQPGFAVMNHQIQFSQIPASPVPPLIPRNMVIPDALSTLQDFMHRMEIVLQRDSDSGSENSAQNQNRPRPPAVPVNQRGVPSTEAIIQVLEQARQLITGNFASSISHLTERLQREAGTTDASARNSMQSEVLRAGISMQHMGALLLELGRTTMTLRLANTPEESFVNAGPAAYIHSNGPNPIMVQPVPMQTAPLFGVSGGPFHGEDLENINIEIHAGSIPMPTSGDPSQQNQQTGDPQPIRSLAPGVVAAIPARTTGGPTGHMVSVIYPVQVRAQGSPPNAAPQAQVNMTSENGQNSGVGSLLGQISSQLTSMLSGRNLGQGNNNAGANAAPQAQPTTGQPQPTAGQASQTIDPPGNLRTRSLNRQSGIKSGGVQTSASSEENQEKKSEEKKPEGSSDAAPLGLGLGGLRPAKKTKQSGSSSTASPASRSPAEGVSSQSEPSNLNPIEQIMRSVLSQSGSGSGPNPTRQGPQMMSPQGGDGGNIGSMLSQVLQSPALDNLLTNMAGPGGIGMGLGSASEMRGMLEQCTRDPAVEGMFTDLVNQVDRQRTGQATGASTGGVDLSGLVQRMLPIVANVISGSSAGTRSQDDEVPVQQPQSGTGTGTNTTRIGEIPLQRAAVRIEGNDSASNIFTSVVESAGFYDGGDTDIMDLVDELSSDHDLANDYMNVLYEEIRKRLQSDSNNGNKS